MTFKNLLSQPEILKAIEEMGYENPTPIQSQAIPEILKGCDLRASAQTGTGKTAAFILPCLVKLANSPIKARGPRLLVLVPTRELAMQVATEASKYSKYLPKVKTVCIYGGAPYPPQIKDLQRPYEILVATPGRLMDHMERNRIDFSHLEVLILDEADRMLDMGFIDAVEQIADATPKTRQTLMFSATLKGSVLKLSQRLLNKPVEITVAMDTTAVKKIDQRLHNVDGLEHKYRLLDHILSDKELAQVIVFTSTKHQADRLVEKLYESGHHVAALHGGMKQRQRSKTIMQLRREEIRVLVATDVAARGIDVSTISHVVNFDLPMGVEDYVHRIGRTGRAGASGIAISFATSKDNQLVRRIEQFTGQKIPATTIPGMEPKMRASFGSERDRGDRRRRSGPPMRQAQGRQSQGQNNQGPSQKPRGVNSPFPSKFRPKPAARGRY